MSTQPDTADRPLLPDCALCGIDDLGLIRVSGKDAVTFLQGQVTNDIKQVSDRHSQLSAYCSPKGRMMALFRVFRRGDDLYLILPKERLEPILKRLRMFVLRSEVTLDDLSGEWSVAGLAGDCAGQLLPSLATEADGVATQGELTLIRVAGDRDRALVIGPTAAIQDWWQPAAAHATHASDDTWALLDIRAGLPTVVDATAEAFVPQMANLQLVNGVSFTKGCYTGQEVVARMQYLGTLKRRMYRARYDGPCVAPGTELFSPSSASGQGAGKVVDARPSPDGGCEALVVTQISSAEANDLRIGDVDGPALTLLDMPYAFEAEKSAH